MTELLKGFILTVSNQTAESLLKANNNRTLFFEIRMVRSKSHGNNQVYEPET